MSELDKILIRARTQPLLLGKILWPGVKVYAKQREIVQSVFFDSVETVVPAGNMLG